ncbi:ATP/GTP-binding protein [Longispora albida]|uniref:ATP/GTP-binding protein n=1 Tax=Longispora albida TaxID=203523 RepID=UPI00036C26EC|nr:AAA family ATPase [Longispora albida]
MKRFVLTGTPGAGKTTILGGLAGLGYTVVAEAATDVIAASRRRGEKLDGPDLIDEIVACQRERQAGAAGSVQFFDRSPVCTYALSVYAGRPPSAALEAELDRIQREEVYERRVFFVRTLGHVERTAVRRITLPEALRFERIHQEVYEALGYELAEIPPGPVAGRLALITSQV